MTPKSCPLGHTILDIHYSTSRYWCCECRKYYPFPLKEGKKSILIEGLVGGDEETEQERSEKTRS